jgi:predicted ATPase
VPEDHPLHAVLADTPHVRIDLEGLTPTEVAALVDRDDAGDLHARSAGNPFLALTLSQAPDLRVPPAARDVLTRRFAALSPDTRRLLEAAAVIGQEFELGVLEPLANLPDEGFLDGLDAAIAAGLVAELPGNVERCMFAHGLVRDALLEAMTAARRRRLHAHAADLVEDPARLAHHLCQAAPLVEPQRIAAAALVAAEQAMAQRAYDEVVEGCTRALAVLPADAAEECRPLMLRRAVAFQALSHLVVDVR